MSSHRSLVLTVALLCAAAPLRAQDTIPHPGANLFGAGVNVQGGGMFSGPLALQLGHEWRAPNSRFGLRLSGEYTETSIGDHPLYPYYSFESIGTTRSHARVAGVSLLTSFVLATGRVQPYLLSGFMFQQRYTRSERDLIALDAPPVGYPSGFTFTPTPAHHESYSTSANALGVEAGAGFQVQVSRAWLYVEMRTLIDASSTIPGEVKGKPITLGIRF